MRLGIHLPHHRSLATTEAVTAVAKRAEELGYTSIWVSDHIILPDTADNAHRFNFFDPLTVLAYVSALTDRVRIGTTVIILPYRNPIVVAKMLSTIDHLSHGRLTAGFGSGTVIGEFEALGVSWQERGAICDEYLAAILELWTQDSPQFSGRYVQFGSVKFEPKPMQRPHPPVWVGGNSKPALRRAARFGDVWHPSGLLPEEIAERLPYLRDQAGREMPITLRSNVRLTKSLDPAERDAPGPHGRPVPLRGTPQEVADQIDRYADIGVSEIVLDINATTLDGYLAAMEAIAEQAIVAR